LQPCIFIGVPPDSFDQRCSLFKRHTQVRFITYLTRFLLNFDGDVQRWWFSSQDGGAGAVGVSSGLGVNEAAVNELKRKRFEALAKTVQNGLREFSFAKKGPTALLSLMRSRYGQTLDGRRQLAILFAFLPGQSQPVTAISRLIASADNASIAEVSTISAESWGVYRVSHVTACFP
jgi:hypothetical protein